MKTVSMMMVVVLSTFVACVDPLQTTDATQSICTEDNPGCNTDWFSLRSNVSNYAQNVSDTNGLGVTDRSDGGCGSSAPGVSYCTSVWQLTGSHWLETTCTRLSNKSTSCSSWLCHETSDGESCSILLPQ